MSQRRPASVGAKRVLSLTVDRVPAAAIEGLAAVPGERVLRADVGDVGAEVPELIRRVRAAGLAVEDVQVRGPSLHAVFLHLTGRELRE